MIKSYCRYTAQTDQVLFDKSITKCIENCLCYFRRYITPDKNGTSNYYSLAKENVNKHSDKYLKS